MSDLSDFLTSVARFFVKIYFHKKCGVFEACKKVTDFFDTLKNRRLASGFLFVDHQSHEHQRLGAAVCHRMTLAVGAEGSVARVQGNDAAVVAVFALTGQHAVVFAVALMYMPAELTARIESYYREYSALAVKLLRSFDYALKVHAAAAAEYVFACFALVFVIPYDHQSLLLPPIIIKNLMSCASDTASAAT